ncbi:MAG: hypothetical protein E6K10_05490 [Methanobacteriota archaeon]|nr:MAG: hypothetical protein E6K10_05490 [Euryarchaeota archaeon]
MSMPPPATPPPAYGPPGAPPMYGPPPAAKPHTWKPMLAGILLIIAAIDGMSFWGTLAFAGAALSGMLGSLGGMFQTIFLICGAIAIIFGIIAILGGIMAIRRKMWGLALVGSILGLFFLGWAGFEASLMSFIALILLAISRSEF